MHYMIYISGGVQFFWHTLYILVINYYSMNKVCVIKQYTFG